MSSVGGPCSAGNRRRRTSTITAVSSTDSVVWQRYATPVGILHRDGRRLLRRLHQDGAAGRVSRSADHLVVARVADQQDREVAAGEPPCLPVHLGDQRARRVDHRQPPRRGVVVHRGRDAVRGEHDQRALRHVALVLDEAPRPWPRGRRRRGGCGRSPGARTPGRRTGAARVPPCRWRARRQRSSRADGRGECVSPGHGRGTSAVQIVPPRSLHATITRRPRPFGRCHIQRSLCRIGGAHSGTRLPSNPSNALRVAARPNGDASGGERSVVHANKEVRATTQDLPSPCRGPITSTKLRG